MAFWTEADYDEHELVELVHDRKSGLTAIIAVHSSHLGPAAGGRPEVRGMDCDDRGQARLAVMHEFYKLVLVVIRLGPECHRARLCNRLIRRQKSRESGAIEGSRTPDLRYHKPAL